jgi:hypothetical protein
MNEHEFKISDLAFKNWDNDIACPRCRSKVLKRMPAPRKEEGENATLF